MWRLNVVYKWRFYRDVLLKKLKLFYSKSRPASGIKYTYLLYDNTLPHTAHIVKLFLKDKRITMLNPFTAKFKNVVWDYFHVQYVLY